MVAAKSEGLERANSGLPVDTAAAAAAATTAVVVHCNVQHGEDSFSRDPAPPAAAARRGESESKKGPHLTECGEIISFSSVSRSPKGRETLSNTDAGGGASAAMPGDKGCISSGYTQARAHTRNPLKSRENVLARLRNDHADDNDSRTRSSSATFTEVASSSLRRSGPKDASSVGSRQHERRRRNPASLPAGPPLPSTNPPPHLVRRTSRREVAPNLRYVCYCCCI